MTQSVEPAAVVAFWHEAGPKRWFKKNAEFDARFREQFMHAHLAAARGNYPQWAESPQGALALCLLLDQFPRNAFRGTAHMYATDFRARQHARAAIDKGLDQHQDAALRLFFYLPFAHSENIADQHESVRLHETLGEEDAKHARQHRAIIERFGRFPHRNEVLGRVSTEAEVAFLVEGGFKG